LEKLPDLSKAGIFGGPVRNIVREAGEMFSKGWSPSYSSNMPVSMSG
jgi:hypothetical protein